MLTELEKAELRKINNEQYLLKLLLSNPYQCTEALIRIDKLKAKEQRK